MLAVLFISRFIAEVYEMIFESFIDILLLLKLKFKSFLAFRFVWFNLILDAFISKVEFASNCELVRFRFDVEFMSILFAIKTADVRVLFVSPFRDIFISPCVVALVLFASRLDA